MIQDVLLVSDFNIDLLGRFLRDHHPSSSVTVAPFAQVHQTLIGALPSDTTLVVWTQPATVIGRYKQATELAEVEHDAVLEEVDEYLRLLESAATRVRHLLVPTWTRLPDTATYGMLDMAPGLGLSHLLARMNLRLAEGLAHLRNVHVLDAQPWLHAGGAVASAPKMWFAAKVPFANAVFQHAATSIRAALLGLSGKSRRLLVLDLDGTLWGGVVGETGWPGIALGGHHHEGEAFLAFQRALRALNNSGVQLGIVSKNDEAVALEAIDKHPAMHLRRKDFVGWRINWNDKAANVAELASEVNLGLSSVVFIDDNPMERARVREALPEVLVPDWPDDPAKFEAALWGLRCFDVPTLTNVDRQRAAMYAADRERRASAVNVGSIDTWLKTLELVVTAQRLSTENLSRAAQLLNKTNQLNLATRRLSESELVAWAGAPGNHLFTFNVRDRFGDAGLVGVVGLSCRGARAEVSDFLLSCRVMGRKVEDAMLHVASVVAMRAGCTALEAQYRPTERNRPTREVLEQSQLEPMGDELFGWRHDTPYPLPDAISLDWPDAESRPQ